MSHISYFWQSLRIKEMREDNLNFLQHVRSEREFTKLAGFNPPYLQRSGWWSNFAQSYTTDKVLAMKFSTDLTCILNYV